MICASAVALCLPLHAAAADWTLSAAVERAIAAHPDVLRAEATVRGAEQSRRGAGAPRANPTLSVEAGPRFSGNGPQADVGVSLSVPLDLGGTPRHTRTTWSAQLEGARSQLARTRLEVAARTRVAYADAVAANRRVQLGEEALELARTTERAALRRHELGEVSLMEPNFAALERTSAQAALLDLRRAAASAERRLRELLAIDGLEALALEPPPTPSWPEGAPRELADLQSAALASRDDVQSTESMARSAEAGVTAAKAAGAPGTTVSGGWDREGDEANIIRGGLSVELPLARNQLGVAAAQVAADQAGIAASVATLDVSRQVAAAVSEWDAATELYALTSGEALRLAQENLALVVRAYEAGKEGLLAVLVMQRQALMTRQSAIEAERALHGAAASLELALGVEMTR